MQKSSLPFVDSWTIKRTVFNGINCQHFFTSRQPSERSARADCQGYSEAIFVLISNATLLSNK